MYIKCGTNIFFITFFKFVGSWNITRLFCAHIEGETVIHKLIKRKITLQFLTFFFYYQTLRLSTRNCITKFLKIIQ